jgi:hypothetical protein
VLVGSVPATLLVGAVFAVWLRNRRPETYARIGEGAEPAAAQEVAA